MKQYIWHIPLIMCKEKARMIHIQIVEEQIEKQKLFNSGRGKNRKRDGKHKKSR